MIYATMHHTYQALSNGREVGQPKLAKTPDGLACRRGLVAFLAVMCAIETTVLIALAVAHLLPSYTQHALDVGIIL